MDLIVAKTIKLQVSSFLKHHQTVFCKSFCRDNMCISLAVFYIITHGRRKKPDIVYTWFSSPANKNAVCIDFYLSFLEILSAFY